MNCDIEVDLEGESAVEGEGGIVIVAVIYFSQDDPIHIHTSCIPTYLPTYLLMKEGTANKFFILAIMQVCFRLSLS